MGDSAPGTLSRHIQLSEFDVSLERSGDQRLQPVVQGLHLLVTAAGLAELTQGLVDEADRRAPVGIRLKDVRVGEHGIDVVMRVEKSIFRSDLSTRLVLSAPGDSALRIELTDVDMPSWVPLDMLLDTAVKKGGAAIRRDPGNARALLLDPAALLAMAGVPGRFAPGRWAVTTSEGGVDLSFREVSAAG